MIAKTTGPLSGACSNLGIDHTMFAVVVTQFGAAILSCVFNFYYVKVFLNIYHISEWWFQLAQVLFMIWNALNDPLFGYFQDVGGCGYNWMRNRRLSVLYFGPFLAVSFLIPWFPWTTSDNSASWVVGIHLITALFFYDGFFSFALLAWCALFAEVTTVHSERVKLVKYNQIATLIAVNCIVIVEKSSSSLQDLFTFRLVTVIISIIATIAFLYTGLCAPDTVAQTQTKSYTRLKDNLAQDDDATRETVSADLASAKWRESFRYTIQIVTSPNFHRVTWTNFFHTLRTTSHANFAAIFTEGLIPRNYLPLGSWQISAFYWICSVVPQLVVITNARIVERFGAYAVFRRGLILSVVAGLLMLFLGRHSPLLILLYIFIDSILTFTMSPMFMILFPDLIDDDMIRHRRSAPLSSLIFSLNALFVKPAQSLAPMIVVAIMNRFDYDSYKMSGTKSDSATNVSKEINKISHSSAAQFYDTSQSDWAELRDVMFGLLCGINIVVATIQFVILRNYTLHDKHRRHESRDHEDQIMPPELAVHSALP